MVAFIKTLPENGDINLVASIPEQTWINVRVMAARRGSCDANFGSVTHGSGSRIERLY